MAAAAAEDVNVDDVAELWLAEKLTADLDGDDETGDYWAAPDAQGTGKDEWAVLAALAFLHRRGVTLAPIGPVLRLIWLEGWAIGDSSARAVLAGGDVAWSWAEGDAEAARRFLPESSRTAVDGWTASAAGWVQSTTAGRLQAVARALSDGATAGLTSRQLAQRLRGVLRDPAWGHTVALTELVRASSAATVDVYRQAGVAAVEWVTEEDDRTCQQCLANEAQGPTPASSAWPDGSDAPPAHPRCRCWLAPA